MQRVVTCSLGSIGALSLLLLSFGWAQPVAACAAMDCGYPQIFPASGTLPANIPAFSWWRDWTRRSRGSDVEVMPDEIRLARVDGGTPELIALQLSLVDRMSGLFSVKPASPLVPGGSYVMWSSPDCGGTVSPTPPAVGGPSEEAAVARFSVSEPAELPSSLGTLHAGPAQSGELAVAGGAACSFMLYSVFVDLTLELSPEAEPWRDALFETTAVDAKPYRPATKIQPGDGPEPGRSWQGAQRDRVFAPCTMATSDGVIEGTGMRGGVTEGVHTARLQASLPGTTLALATNSVDLELRCSEPVSRLVDAGAGEPPSDPKPAGSGAAAQPKDAHAREPGGCAVADGGSLALPMSLLLLALRRRCKQSRLA